jgi:histone H3/H4
MVKISKRFLETALKKHGAKRVSKEAKVELAKRIEELIKQTSKLAARNARHFGRITLSKKDIQFALESESNIY